MSIIKDLTGKSTGAVQSAVDSATGAISSVTDGISSATGGKNSDGSLPCKSAANVADVKAKFKKFKNKLKSFKTDILDSIGDIESELQNSLDSIKNLAKAEEAKLKKNFKDSFAGTLGELQDLKGDLIEKAAKIDALVEEWEDKVPDVKSLLKKALAGAISPCDESVPNTNDDGTTDKPIPKVAEENAEEPTAKPSQTDGKSAVTGLGLEEQLAANVVRAARPKAKRFAQADWNGRVAHVPNGTDQAINWVYASDLRRADEAQWFADTSGFSYEEVAKILQFAAPTTAKRDKLESELLLTEAIEWRNNAKSKFGERMEAAYDLENSNYFGKKTDYTLEQAVKFWMQDEIIFAK